MTMFHMSVSQGQSLTHQILEPQELLPAHCLSLQTPDIYIQPIPDVQVHFQMSRPTLQKDNYPFKDSKGHQ